MPLTFEVKYQTTMFTRSKSRSDLELAKTLLIYEFKGGTKVDMCVIPIVPCGRLHKNAAMLVSLGLMKVFNSNLCEHDKINIFQNYKYVSLCSVIGIFMLLTIVESQSARDWRTCSRSSVSMVWKSNWRSVSSFRPRWPTLGTQSLLKA